MMHRKPWLTLRFRLVAWYLLLAGVSTLVFDGFVYYDFRQLLLSQVDTSLRVASIQALKNIDDEVDQLEFDARPDSTLLASLLNQAGLEIYLRGRDGSLKAGFGQSLVLAAESDVRLGFQTMVTPDGRWRTFTQEIASRNRRPPGWLTVARSLEPVDATLTDVFNRHLLKLPFLLGIVGCCGFFLASRALKPIGQIAQAARQVRISADLSQRVHYQGSVNDELARLATMFDEMLASLQTNFAQQSQLIADASHELRTPLTTLNGHVQVALSQPRTAEAYVESLEAIQSEVARLIRLSTDLLLLSRLELHHQELDLELVHLSDLLQAIAAQIRPLVDLKRLKFVTDIAPELRVQASPDHLIRLFLNLLDNAVKYTPEQGLVALRAEAQSEFIVVSVSDSGIGIAEEHLPHLFDRFYRVDKSRSRAMGGTGLGLAIAQEIVHRHHAAISVHSLPSSGTTFTVRFRRDAA